MYVPKILLCGDRNKFLQKLGDRQVEIIGQIRFKGAAERGDSKVAVNLNELKKITLKPEDFQIFIDGRAISFDELKKIMTSTADYIVFDNGELISRLNELWQLGFKERFITTGVLLNYARDNFYATTNAELLVKSFRKLNVSRVLDLDNFLAKNALFYTWLNPDVEIEAVDSDSFAKKYPVVENLCRKIYPSLDECRLKNYDAILITAEREPDEFFELITATDSMAEKILTFVRKNSTLDSCLKEYLVAFEKVGKVPAINGEWIFLKKFSPPEDFCIYVVTHKDVKLDNALPDGYRIIHAGHLTAKEKFGYLGDDTGDNISKLNRYLNEITALYWIWKNTRHTIIGLCHYRRFFTAQGNWNPNSVNQHSLAFNAEKFLTAEEAIKVLRDCDIIVVKGYFFSLTQTELKTVVCDSELNKYVEKIFRKYIKLKQPDYLEAFDYVSSSYSEFLYEMFITRRKVFEAYCQWLFSFIVHVTAEVLATTNLAENNNPRKYRSIGLVSERLMTVWLIKNRLRIKTLPIMFRKDV